MKKEDRRLFSHRFQEESIFVHTTDEDINPWDRTRIVAVLVNETGIDYHLADKISEEIQSIIFSSGIKVITSELVRELVNAKLVEHRFEKARERNRRLGLSLYDVGSLLRYPTPLRPEQSPTPAGVSSVMAETIKRQYALSDIFPPHIHRLHLEGRFHIHGLSAPDRPLMAWIRVGDLLRFQYVANGLIINKPTDGKSLIRNLLKLDTVLRGMVHERLTWFGLEQALQEMGTPVSHISELVCGLIAERELLGSVSGLARSAVHLESRACVEAIVERFKGELLMFPEILAIPDSWRPSPWIRMAEYPFGKTTFVMEAVSLNLPGLGIRSVVEDTSLDAELHQITDKAATVFAQRRVYLEKLAAVRPDGPLDLLGRLGFRPSEAPGIIGVCGLNEMIRVLMDGDMDEGDSRLQRASQFMNSLRVYLKELAAQRRIGLILGTADQMDAAYRFARLDLKFQPYYAARILNGDIAEAAVYYSRDASLPSEKPVELSRKLAIEGLMQQAYDLPFLSVVKHRDPSSLNRASFTKPLRHLLLTADFSLCYNCHTMDSGVYLTCPNCHDATVAVYRATTEGYHSEAALSRAVRLEQERYFYY